MVAYNPSKPDHSSLDANFPPYLAEKLAEQ